MEHSSSTQQAQSTANEAFGRLADEAGRQGMVPLSPRWEGSHHEYLFRCAAGHQFTRRATVMMRGRATCHECVQEGVRRRFLDTLEQRGIVCLESGYLGQRVRHRLQCRQDHCWDAEARKVMEGSGCPVCANAQVAAMNTHAGGLERLQEAAAKRGGRCLSDISGIVANYEWECANGHRWHSRGDNVVRGGWCRICFGLRHSDRMTDPNGLIRLQAAATSQGGQCLDSDYVGVNRRYWFRCAAGHEWQTHGSHVLRGGWCLRCARKRLTEASRVPDGLQQLQAAAATRGGQLMDSEYVGIAARYTFRCSRGHQWKTRGERVLGGGWCQRCAGLRRRHTIETMQQIAHDRGGRCLSTEYRGVKVRLSWECHRAHVWESSADSIINGETWCPNCATLDRTKNQHLRQRYDYEGQ